MREELRAGRPRPTCSAGLLRARAVQSMSTHQGLSLAGALRRCPPARSPAAHDARNAVRGGWPFRRSYLIALKHQMRRAAVRSTAGRLCILRARSQRGAAQLRPEPRALGLRARRGPGLSSRRGRNPPCTLSYFFPDHAGLFDQLADNCGMARLWAGIHYRSDHEQGMKLGRSVARMIIEQLEGGCVGPPPAGSATDRPPTREQVLQPARSCATAPRAAGARPQGATRSGLVQPSRSYSAMHESANAFIAPPGPAAGRRRSRSGGSPRGCRNN